MKQSARTYPRRGLHGELVHRLGLKIVSGEWVEGAVIPTDGDFGSGLSVSRSVARETFRVLAAKGLVDSRQNVGTRVRGRADWRLLDVDVLEWLGESGGDPQILRELTELREFIEPRAAYHAASRATEDERNDLQRLFEEMVRAVDDPDPFSAADIAFHTAIVSACHNAVLAELSDSIGVGLLATRRWTLVHFAECYGPTALRGSLPVHEKVLEAIITGSQDDAFQTMSELIGSAVRDVEKLLQQAESSGATPNGDASRATAFG